MAITRRQNAVSRLVSSNRGKYADLIRLLLDESNSEAAPKLAETGDAAPLIAALDHQNTRVAYAALVALREWRKNGPDSPLRRVVWASKMNFMYSAKLADLSTPPIHSALLSLAAGLDPGATLALKTMGRGIGLQSILNRLAENGDATPLIASIDHPDREIAWAARKAMTVWRNCGPDSPLRRAIRACSRHNISRRRLSSVPSTPAVLSALLNLAAGGDPSAPLVLMTIGQSSGLKPILAALTELQETEQWKVQREPLETAVLRLVAKGNLIGSRQVGCGMRAHLPVIGGSALAALGT